MLKLSQHPQIPLKRNLNCKNRLTLGSTLVTKLALCLNDCNGEKMKGNDQEPIQSNATFCSKHQTGKEHIHTISNR